MGQCWYIRRGEAIRGPFPESVLGSLLASGKLRGSDMLSTDMKGWAPAEGWQPAPAGPGPGAGRADTDPRRPPVKGPPPTGSAVSRYLSHARPTAERPGRQVALVGVAVALLGLAVVTLHDPDDTRAPDCSAPAGRGVNWANCRLEQMQAPRADLAEAVLRNARLDGARLDRASLPGADLSYAGLSDAGMTYADLRGANLMGADLRRADLAGADLAGARLDYADLRGAVVLGASLEGASLGSTIWIDGSRCVPGSVTDCGHATAEGPSRN